MPKVKINKIESATAPTPAPSAQPVTAPADSKQIFGELCQLINDAAESLNKLQSEQDPEKSDELKYEFYASLLDVTDDVKEMLKSFRKKYKLTEKEVREYMTEPASAPVNSPAENSAASQ